MYAADPVQSPENGIVPGTPAAEFNVTQELVRKLVASQFPQYAQRALQPLDAGFDNVLYRLGEDLLVRMPRRAVADNLLRNEQTWLPRLSSQLDICIPQPLHRGSPEFGYPWSSVCCPGCPVVQLIWLIQMPPKRRGLHSSCLICTEYVHPARLWRQLMQFGVCPWPSVGVLLKSASPV